VNGKNIPFMHDDIKLQNVDLICLDVFSIAEDKALKPIEVALMANDAALKITDIANMPRMATDSNLNGTNLMIAAVTLMRVEITFMIILITAMIVRNVYLMKKNTTMTIIAITIIKAFPMFNVTSNTLDGFEPDGWLYDL